MSFPTIEPIDRVEGSLEALHQRRRVDEIEIVGSEGREHPHAHIGRRRAMRDTHLRSELHVVGRQPVIVLSDKSIEVMPGLFRNVDEERPVLIAKLDTRARGRTAQEKCDERRSDPRREKRQRNQE